LCSARIPPIDPHWRAASAGVPAPIVAFRLTIALVRGSCLPQHGLCSSYTLSGAIFLILELDRPFDGVFQIPRQIVLNALDQFAK
jgi:hypothetical protein